MAFHVHSCSLRCSIAQKMFPDFFFVERKSIFLISYFELFFTHDKKAHSSSVLGWLSQLFLAWPSWTTIAVVCMLAGLHNGFWIVRNILLLRLSAVFPSVNLFWFLSVFFFPFFWMTASMVLSVATHFLSCGLVGGFSLVLFLWSGEQELSGSKRRHW